ncbi:MAG: hypothetical protein IJ722_07440 [Alloprevotella sp.]|nr:hypothetical protein [Alloprevotella sp.]
MRRTLIIPLAALFLIACGGTGGQEGGSAPADFIEKHKAELDSLCAQVAASRSTQELEAAVRAYEQAEADFQDGLTQEDSLRLAKNVKARQEFAAAKVRAQLAASERLEKLLKIAPAQPNVTAKPKKP